MKPSRRLLISLKSFHLWVLVSHQTIYLKGILSHIMSEKETPCKCEIAKFLGLCTKLPHIYQCFCKEERPNSCKNETAQLKWDLSPPMTYMIWIDENLTSIAESAKDIKIHEERKRGKAKNMTDLTTWMKVTEGYLWADLKYKNCKASSRDIVAWDCISLSVHIYISEQGCWWRLQI